MSQFRQQLRGHMVGPPCWLTSYLNLTSLHPEVELSRTSHYHQRIIFKTSKNIKKNILRKSTFLLKQTPTWPWNCRILECIRVLASAFTWSRPRTPSISNQIHHIHTCLEKWWYFLMEAILNMVISTASAPKDSYILFGGIPGPPTVESGPSQSYLKSFFEKSNFTTLHTSPQLQSCSQKTPTTFRITLLC